MNKKLSWGIGIIVAIVIIWFGFFNKPSEPVSTEPIKIGGLFGQTGFAAFAGEASKNGFIMAIEDSGIDVDYVIEDYNSDLKTTVSAAKKLIDIDKVSVIVGPEWVEFGEVIVPISEETETLFISPWMNLELDWAKSPYYFSMTPSNRNMIREEIKYMEDKDMNNIIIIYHNNSFALASINLLKDELLKNNNIKIVEEVKVGQDQTDFRTELTKIKENNQYDVIYTVFATDDGQGVFNKQLKELGIDSPVFLSLARAESNILLESFGEYTNGMIYSSFIKNKKGEDFSKKYEERFGVEPLALSAAGAYDATTLILEAMKKGARTSEEVKEYLLKIKNYKGYSNIINFNESGQVVGGSPVIKRVNGNNPVILR
ncbi:MAG: ABC transporter substrate-binding protein [Candidatus Pacebacteria bacterium]|nr:ABC transporter substrate-binding protein [Candidatus Paceibacterota bacterium]